MDRHPDIIYSRGEAWLYEQILRMDPSLFERVRRHIEAGRWSTVGGWYIQPDCNLPSGFALERQIALGQEFFREHFGQVPRIGYNVDSFGHAATLPEFMRKAGQSYYVMMRPQGDELKLPARLFRWRGYTGGPEVITFRIASSYCTPEGFTPEHIRDSASELPEGISDTMCFIGIGDHGGGPTEEMIEWCRANRNSVPGLELEFSSPEKFFAAIQPDAAKLPLFTGELQFHAVGCYSVHRPVKNALRKAEHRLVQAETALKKWGIPPVEAAREVNLAWKQVCFHHFHDTLGGTCLPSAYEDVHAQLGRALAIAEDAATISLRRHLSGLKNDPAQRIFLFNASDHPFADYVEVEPWLEWTQWQPGWRLVDEYDELVAFQVLHGEAVGDNQARLLLFVAAAPGEVKVIRIVNGKNQVVQGPGGFSVAPNSLRLADGPAVHVGENGWLDLPEHGTLPLPRLTTYDDPSDTWSHGIDRYVRKNPQTVQWQPPALIEQGALRASLIQTGTLGSSAVLAEWRIYRDQPWVECLLRVVWMEQHRVLKLEWDMSSDISEHEDGIMGGSMVRPVTGAECPLRDWTRLTLRGNSGETAHLAVVAPEVYALDVEPYRAGLTLLRSCLMAWHAPATGDYPRGVFSDRGEHFFRFRFLSAGTLSAADLDRMAFDLQRPLLTADVTRGMKNRALKQKYTPPSLS